MYWMLQMFLLLPEASKPMKNILLALVILFFLSACSSTEYTTALSEAYIYQSPDDQTAHAHKLPHNTSLKAKSGGATYERTES